MKYEYKPYGSVVRGPNAADRYRPLIGMTASEDHVPMRLKMSQTIYHVRKPLKIPREEFIGHLVHCFGGQMETDVPWVPKAEFPFRTHTRAVSRGISYSWIYDHVIVPLSGEWTELCKEMDDIFCHRKMNKRYTDEYICCFFRHYDVRVI
jgi:hypothetical protein